ncbi:MAG: RNA 2',3'-cyclic phosphodiesterase [Gammaproteobacteria bacterium]|nr:RNA 2',3'-cyclic phosphodiesterase [Gammaproteobacteria bacterium]NNM21125.1 RNA 2',3'-cyclic phosphodiesterase [Gammaproteobacteria bacterium]
MTGTTKRLFFALWPDEETGDSILRATRSVVADSEGRPVLPQNLHITLAFLHSVDSETVACVEQAATRVTTSAFDLVLDRVGFWHRSRILWLAPAPEEVAAPGILADALWRELEVCGFSAERRRYRPHVTLARKAQHAVYATAVPKVRWRADSFCLVESITGQRQSEYLILRTFPLR